MKLKNFLKQIPKLPLPARLRHHKVLWLALAGILILSFFAKDFYQYFGFGGAGALPLLQVQTVRVKEAPMPEVINTIGTLTAEKELKIKAGGAGRIQKFVVPSGSYVKEGTLLANIIAGPEVRAPFDGYLSDWIVKPGEIVAVGTDLVDIVNTDTLLLTYKVPESYASRLDLAQGVEVSVKAFPDKKFQGTVEFIAPSVDRRTYTILIKAKVNNATQDLWPGMSAHVRQILAMHEHALVIPEACLLLSMEGYEIMVVADGKVQTRKVQIGEKINGRVHIKSGVNLNDSVVLTKTFAVIEGANAVANDWTGDW